MRLRAHAALLVAIAGITWSAILVRWAGVPGTASAFYRVLIAGAVLIPWAAFARASSASGKATTAKARPVSRRAAWLAVAGGVFFALDLALWATAVMRTHAAVASTLANNVGGRRSEVGGRSGVELRGRC